MNKRLLQFLAILNMVVAVGLLVAARLMPTDARITPDVLSDRFSESIGDLKRELVKDPAERPETWKLLQPHRQMTSKSDLRNGDEDIDLLLGDPELASNVIGIEVTAEAALRHIDFLSERSIRNRWLFRIAHIALGMNAILLLLALVARDGAVAPEEDAENTAQAKEPE